MKKSILFLFILSFLSCGNIKSIPDFENEVSFDFKERIVFQIDSLTNRNSRNLGFSKGASAIYLFNEVNYVLYLYDVEDGRDVRTIQLFKDGPNGVGKVSKVLVHNVDSIFVFNRHSNQLFMLGNAGDIVTKYQVLSFKDDSPSVQTLSPSVHFNSENKSVFLPVRANERTSEVKKTTLLEFGLKSGELRFLLKSPESLNDGSWADAGSTSFGTYNSSENKYVISYAHDPQLYVVDLTNSDVSSYPASSARIKEPEIYRGDWSTYDKIFYQTTNSWYGNVFYDEYNKVYLREAQVGKRMDKGDSFQNSYPSVNGDDVYSLIIILDQNFQKIGEVLGKKIFNYVFSTKQGIYIRNYGYDRENEDILVFDRYNLGYE